MFCGDLWGLSGSGQDRNDFQLGMIFSGSRDVEFRDTPRSKCQILLTSYNSLKLAVARSGLITSPRNQCWKTRKSLELYQWRFRLDIGNIPHGKAHPGLAQGSGGAPFPGDLTWMDLGTPTLIQQHRHRGNLREKQG